MGFHPFQGVCSRGAEFDIDDQGLLRNVKIIGGCPGNTHGVSLLSEGRDAREIASMLKGTDCRGKGTSCPDQLARAIEADLAKLDGIVTA